MREDRGHVFGVVRTVAAKGFFLMEMMRVNVSTAGMPHGVLISLMCLLVIRFSIVVN